MKKRGEGKWKKEPDIHPTRVRYWLKDPVTCVVSWVRDRQQVGWTVSQNGVYIFTALAERQVLGDHYEQNVGINLCTALYVSIFRNQRD